MGYLLLPGGVWKGDYLIARMDSYDNLDMLTLVDDKGKYLLRKLHVHRTKEIVFDEMPAIKFRFDDHSGDRLFCGDLEVEKEAADTAIKNDSTTSGGAQMLLMICSALGQVVTNKTTITPLPKRIQPLVEEPTVRL